MHITIENGYLNSKWFRLFNNNLYIGHIYIVINYKECVIMDFEIVYNYQNKGYGSILLNNIINYCRFHNIDKIILDDMSSRFNTKSNIYLKFGFKYLELGYPEMELNL